MDYWQDVDLYIGGSEHATGHLLYARFWTKFLYDRQHAPVKEFAKKLINQGMILGTSAFVYRINERPDNFISKELVDSFNAAEDKLGASDKIKKATGLAIENISFNKIHVNVEFVNSSDELDVSKFREWNQSYRSSKFITSENDVVKLVREVEKMSKSKYNVVNPDDICAHYGADTLRLYEMFLGPLEQAKPWNTAGITGVHSFLKKLWKLYHNGDNFEVTHTEPSKDSLKTLHKTIKKVEEDIENFSFNTSVSTFMIAVNELTAEKCNSRQILEPLAILMSPYAPHIAEELWEKLGHSESISTAPFPKFDASHLVESSKAYPISFNGKMRFTMELSMDLSKDEIEKAVMAHEKTVGYLEGRTPKKVIVVPGKIVNIVG